MEHNPYITMEDETEITYSDLKIRENGDEYVTIYLETPSASGFKSMSVDYPGDKIKDIVRYTDEEVAFYCEFLEKYKTLILEDAKEDGNYA